MLFRTRVEWGSLVLIILSALAVDDTEVLFCDTITAESHRQSVKHTDLDEAVIIVKLNECTIKFERRRWFIVSAEEITSKGKKRERFNDH